MRIKHLLKAAPVLVALAVMTSGLQPAAAASDSKFSSGYIYFGKPASYLSMIEDAGHSLNQISPSYFDLNTDGTLKLNASIDKNLIAQMKQKGIKVVPFLSNHWDRQTGIKALQSRELLAQQVANAVVSYNLDGVDVDIENVTPSERAMYVDFLRLLRAKLPQGSTLSAAVAANPQGINSGWQGSYDYAGLAQYCDHLVIMAYDEHYESGPEGPVASAQFVEKSIQYALKKIPASKVVLGIPFYGRYWKQGSSYGGYGISDYTVENLIAKYKGTVTYDAASRSPKAVITLKAGDEKPVVLGKPLETGTYTIWYENDASIKYKLRLVQKYGLKGTADWSLGQETADTWSYYRLWLEGKYFSDTEGHWAQDAILTSDLNGWMIGGTSTLFMPDQALTRAQASVVLTRLMGLETTAQQSSFKDTRSHWAWKEIEAAYQAGIVQGTGDGNFDPDQRITREQMAVMLDRLLDQTDAPAGTENVFTDVSKEELSWSYDAIINMAYYGVMQGCTADTFKPGNTLTRAEMATLLVRISGKLTPS